MFPSQRATFVTENFPRRDFRTRMSDSLISICTDTDKDCERRGSIYGWPSVCLPADIYSVLSAWPPGKLLESITGCPQINLSGAALADAVTKDQIYRTQPAQSSLTTWERMGLSVILLTHRSKER
ncbi:hypothetical protein Bbelb_061630 [Branchiostoma belcheri]|nr:hypothetical protein Bbelb_061630 [Branchiostoma belcheri]